MKENGPLTEYGKTLIDAYNRYDMLVDVRHTGERTSLDAIEEGDGLGWFGEKPYTNTAQWDHSFTDGALFKHGNMGQGIYVDPARDFCGMYFGLAPNPDEISGVDHSPGSLRTAAKYFAGQ